MPSLILIQMDFLWLKRFCELSLLQHLAIIMDGNGRWATNLGKPRREGHKLGAIKVREITKACINKNIPYLTLYAFSTENWNRPRIEVDFIMHLLEKYIKVEKDNYLDNGVRFDYIGDISGFSKSLQNKINLLKEKTRCCNRLTQILALNYGSQDEISRTFIKLLDSGIQKNISKFEMKDLIESNLDTRGYPPVDVLIRTGGEYRLSNFLLWQLSYAELFFTKTLWPDFSEQELETILFDFKNRNRKFGKL